MLVATAVALAVAAAVVTVAAVRGDESDCADRCGPTPVQLPAAATYGAPDPAVTVALFVDLESAASRQAFQHVTRSIEGLGLATTMALRLLQLPAAPCVAGAPEVGCVGARAVECAERLAGVGVRGAGAVFDMQWLAESRRTPDAVLAAVAEVGVDADALKECVEHDEGIDGRLASHLALATRHGLAAAPGGLVVVTAEPGRSAGFGAWVTERTLADIVRCLAHHSCEAAS